MSSTKAPGKLVVGIDPGLTGAVAFYDTEKKELQSVHDMPTTPVELAKLVTVQLLLYGIRYAVVEEVSAMSYTDKEGKKRGQGAVASFTFGEGFGVIQGVLGALDIPIVFTRPSVWKTLLSLDSDKNKSRVLAIQKFRSHAELFKRKKDDGRAEAALLALFGAERFK